MYLLLSCMHTEVLHLDTQHTTPLRAEVAAACQESLLQGIHSSLIVRLQKSETSSYVPEEADEEVLLGPR